jgi:hypothetical protein
MKVLLVLGLLLSATASRGFAQETPANTPPPRASIAATEWTAIQKECAAPKAPSDKKAPANGAVAKLSCLQRLTPLFDKSHQLDLDMADLADSQVKEIVDGCGFATATLDTKVFGKNLACAVDRMRKALDDLHAAQALAETVHRMQALSRPLKSGSGTASVAEVQDNSSIDALFQIQSTPKATAVAPETIQPQVEVGTKIIPGAQNTPAPAPPPVAAGQQVGGSAYTTPSTCLVTEKGPANGASIDHPELIGVTRSLLAPKEASDQFGYRLGKRYIIYQVSITDFSKDYQYVVHDITVNLKDVLIKQGSWQLYTDPSDKNETAGLASSRRLDLLRGIPEKGQDLDPRNLTFHILTGVGSVAGGVSGLTAFSDVMGSAVSVFNGAFLQAFVGISPDHTGTQLNRLSDEAFSSNSLVDKLHTKDFAIFIPQALVLKSKNQGRFWSKTRDLLDEIPLDLVDVCVDGSLVTEVSITPPPTFSVTDSSISAAAVVSIQDSASDAVVYYTDDGNTPTSNSNKYDKTKGITFAAADVDKTKVIQAIAISPNKQQSTVAVQQYNLKRMPWIVVTPGAASTDPAKVAITPAVAADTIYYTTNGDDPTTTVTATNLKYDSTKPPTLTASAVVKAIETGTGSPAKPLIATNSYKAK